MHGGSRANGIENGEWNPTFRVVGVIAQLARGSVLALVLTAMPAFAQVSPLTPPGKLLSVQPPPKVVPRLLDLANAGNTRIVVSLSRQRAQLLVDGEAAIDTPVSTGKRRGLTPAGDYTITDKLPEHRSNLHGDFIDKRGRIVMPGVSTRIDAAPAGTVFRAVPVKYFLKCGPDGPALHAGRLPGYPASDTSVRLPRDIAALVFDRVRPGTPVKIGD